MQQNQIKFLAKKFCDNLDISSCDPEVWVTYIQMKRPDNKYSKALVLLLIWSWPTNEFKEKLSLEKIFRLLLKYDVVGEARELLHNIEEDPNEKQFKLFHKLEEYIKAGHTSFLLYFFFYKISSFKGRD